MEIAVIQLAVGADPATNRRRVVDRIRTAAAAGADLVVLPEVWHLGYFNFEAYTDGAEPIDGPTMTQLGDLAADLGIHLHTGSIIERDGDTLYNASGLFDPDGTLLDVYRKIHLFGYDSEERRLLTPGERIVAVETTFGTVGLTTCYDLRFPELYRALVDRGVELLLVTSAWPTPRAAHWRLLTRVRALENQVFLAAANLTGEHGGAALAGRSVIVDPWGVPLADAGTGDRIARTEIDLDDVPRIREEFPALADRRIDAEYRL